MNKLFDIFTLLIGGMFLLLLMILLAVGVKLLMGYPL